MFFHVFQSISSSTNEYVYAMGRILCVCVAFYVCMLGRPLFPNEALSLSCGSTAGSGLGHAAAVLPTSSTGTTSSAGPTGSAGALPLRCNNQQCSYRWM